MRQGHRYESERRDYERSDPSGRWSAERGGERGRGDERWSESSDEGRQGPLRYGDRYGESPYGETRAARGGSYAGEWTGPESRGYRGENGGRAEQRRPWNGGSEWDDDRGRFEGAGRYDNGGSSGRSRDYDDMSRTGDGDAGARYAGGGGSYGASSWRSGGSSMSAGLSTGSGYGPSMYGSGAPQRAGGGSSDWRGQGSYGQGGYGQSDWGQSGQVGYGQGGYRGNEGGWRGNVPVRGEQGWNGGSWSAGSSNAGSYGRSATQERGRFRGKGPKNYRRSDERIKEDVAECLTDAADLDASMIEVEVSEGEVTLKGTVSSREEKRLAESLLDGISGVKDVTNQLRVSPSNEGESSSTYNRKQDQSHSQSSPSGQSSQQKARSSTAASNS